MRYDRKGKNLFAKNFCMRRRNQQKVSNEKNESMETFFCSSPSAYFFSLHVLNAPKKSETISDSSPGRKITFGLDLNRRLLNLHSTV